jgi:hypothetical protein
MSDLVKPETRGRQSFDTRACPPAKSSVFRVKQGDAMPETVVHFQIRMPPPFHERLASWARDDRVSLNALVVAILAEAVERREPGTAGRSGAGAA